jgi:hypothetical protein
MTALNIYTDISGSPETVNPQWRTLVRFGVLRGSGALALFQRHIYGIRSVASRVRSLGDDEYSKNKESKNCDKDNIPSPKFCFSPWPR